MQGKLEAAWDWEGVKGDKYPCVDRRLNANKKARLKYRAFGYSLYCSLKDGKQNHPPFKILLSLKTLYST